MTGIEIFLLLAGCVFMIGSFFVSERLTASELNKIAELSESELKRIIDKGMDNAGQKIDDVIDEKIEEASQKVERAMEKESNEKIMAISEYSDTVVDSMKKTHDEIMFLYSMLNDKHTELTTLTGSLQRLAAEVRNMQERSVKVEEKVKPVSFSTTPKTVPIVSEEEIVPVEEVASEPEAEMVKEPEKASEVLENHNEMILQLHREGLSKVDIARKLSLGLGEVSLVIGLYKGEEK